jgi:hypothetical protein
MMGGERGTYDIPNEELGLGSIIVDLREQSSRLWLWDDIGTVRFGNRKFEVSINEGGNLVLAHRLTEVKSNQNELAQEMIRQVRFRIDDSRAIAVKNHAALHAAQQPGGTLDVEDYLLNIATIRMHNTELKRLYDTDLAITFTETRVERVQRYELKPRLMYNIGECRVTYMPAAQHIDPIILEPEITETHEDHVGYVECHELHNYIRGHLADASEDISGGLEKFL